ncbi:MAG TPA: sterol desaturase family protein [Vicinamibacteria bacterium]|nr:sterol desaturase family protein [Vicinamibacteria bacterium]
MTDGREDRPALDRWFERVFDDAESSRLGSGWLSGTASVFLGGLGLLCVLVLWFPEWLTTARFRALYPLPFVRGLIQGVIAAGFVSGCISMLLRRRKVLGLTGGALSVLAALLGGGGVALPDSLEPRPTLGLDWFVLNLFLLALLFVPLERFFPRLPAQSTFRLGWTTDTLHFFVSHGLVQVFSFLILLPAVAVGHFLEPAGLAAVVRALPLGVQFLAAILVADLAQYAVHRAFHQVPLLWRFHAVHHSSRDMDWLAGSRLHVVDAVVTRGLVLVPLQLAGFAEPALYAYLVFVSFHAVFIHANVRFSFGALESLLVTPRFHHWHHARAAEARDRNLAVHLPWLDRLFGTTHLPRGEWPDGYGIAGDPVPEGYLDQLVHSFRLDLTAP